MSLLDEPKPMCRRAGLDWMSGANWPCVREGHAPIAAFPREAPRELLGAAVVVGSGGAGQLACGDGEEG